MSTTTDIKSGGLVTFSIKVNGGVIPDSDHIISVTVEKAVNRIASARIVILDGDAATGNFEASSSSTFVPGNEVTIEAGYDSENKVIFKGIITKQSIRIDGINGSVLEVECRDKAIRMIVGRKSLTFAKKKDSDIISSIIGTYKGLSAEVTSTNTEWPEQVQYYTTDWDFIRARAEANGFVVSTLNNKVTVFPPDKDTSPVVTIEYGNNLLEFNADLNAVTQLGAAKASSWDFNTQKVVSEEVSNTYAGPGNLSSKKLSEVVDLSKYEVQTTVPLQAPDLTNWSKEALVKSAYSKIQGEVKFQGSNLVEPGKYLTLDGLGDRFNGDHFISRVAHFISDGIWTTGAAIGLSPIWCTQEPDVVAPPASGLLPGVQGLFNGTVKKMYDDPESQFRILVDVPLFDQSGAGIWARLTNFYSTNGGGVFFMPEVGDEVILGFLNEDPRYPIILGSVYSNATLKPASDYTPEEKNPKKAIVSKAGITVEFDDENKIFTIKTPSNNTVILNDKDKSITIKDENSNAIVMSSDGITIKSAKTITLEADQNVEIKGAQGIKVASSGGDVETTGNNIKETANMQFTAKGSMTAQVEGGAELTLKGAMVMIN